MLLKEALEKVYPGKDYTHIGLCLGVSRQTISRVINKNRNSVPVARELAKQHTEYTYIYESALSEHRKSMQNNVRARNKKYGNSEGATKSIFVDPDDITKYTLPVIHPQPEIHWL
jgi:hypothetical protein